MVVSGLLDMPFPVAPRFVVFSLAIFILGLAYLAGTIKGWSSFPSK